MSTVTGKEALMQILRAEGVEYVFGIPGATEAQFVDVMEDHPEIKYVLCMHELAAVGMAEGYARTSGKVGFLNLHTGTGLAAGMPMLSNAWWGGIPLVVTVGQQDTRILAEEAAMSDNLVKIAAPFTKWATEVIRPEDLPTIMRRAFKIATHPPTGPVMVSLPLDVLVNTFEFEYQPSFHSYSKLHPDDRSIAAAVELLATARNPGIIVEDGVTKCEALDEMVLFAEQIGAPVYQPWMADVNFPVHHPLYLGDLDPNNIATRDILEKFDVLVVVGAMFFMQAIPTPLPLVPSTTKVIQIDNNPWQIAKNFPVACGVEGDIKVALADLTEALGARLTADIRTAVAERTTTIAAGRRAMVEAFEKKVLAEWGNTPISGTRMMAELRDAIEPGTRIVDDCWSYSAILRRMLPLKELGEYQRARTGGSIGAGLPTALGAKLASPDRPVVCISGDGSAMWSIQSLWNAAHYEIPVTFIILSNAAYRQVRIMKTKLMGEGVKGRNLGTVLSPPDIEFCKIAEGMGLAARRVTEPGDLRAALTEALSSGVANVIQVDIDPSFSTKAPGGTVKIAIIGAGNIGSLLGALLAAAGQDVTLVELREDIVRAIKADGVTIDMSDGRTLRAPVKVTGDVTTVGVVDLVLLAVKSNATRDAATGAKGIIGDDTWVLSVQNGAGNVETIAEVLGSDTRVIGGVFWCVVTPLGLNRLSWVVGTGGLKIGPATGVVSAEVEQIADILRTTGVDVAISDNVQQLIWGKVLQNVPLALGTALRLTNDEYAAYPHARELILKMAEECVAVTKAAGIDLDQGGDPVQGLVATIEKFHSSGTKPKCSMLQDLEKGRRTEIDAINGSIVREGKRLGIPTPVNEVMVALVKLQEEKNCL